MTQPAIPEITARRETAPGPDAVRYGLRPGVVIEERAGAVRLRSDRPARALDLHPRTRGLLDRLATPVGAGPGDLPGAAADAAEGLLRHLERRGFARLLPPRDGSAGSHPIVSVVVVVRDRPRQLARCLRGVLALDWPPERLEIVVVDDCSGDRTPDVARAFARAARRAGGPAIVVRALTAHAGIAGARNEGVGAATGEIVAFTDSDCVPDAGWLSALVPYFATGEVTGVGGGVDGFVRRTLVQRYEHAFSPLRMAASSRGRAGAGTAVPYMPTCNLLVRRDALLACGGFTAGMSVGEDVDLCRRLEAHGGRLFYEPSGRVRHEHRDELLALLRRRFDYGRSEGTLAQLATGARPAGSRADAQPGTAGPAMRAARVLYGLASAGLLFLFLWRPLFAAGLLAALVTARLALRLVPRPGGDRPLALRVVVGAAPRVLRATVHGFGVWFFRYWSLPAALVALALAGAAGAARFALAAGALLLVTVQTERRRRSATTPGLGASALLFLLDLSAYQLGAWAGGLGARRLGFLLPAAASLPFTSTNGSGALGRGGVAIGRLGGPHAAGENETALGGIT